MSKFTSILFPVDFSDRSRAAAPFVLSLAQRYGAKVVLLHAIQPPPPLYAGMNTLYPETIDFTAIQQDLEIQLRKFAEAEVPLKDVACVVEMGDSATVITAYAEANGISLIAMPTHGYGGFRRALMGSVTAKVLHDAKVPVWTSAHAPEPSHRAHPKPRHILVAIDLKSESVAVLEFGLELAKDSDATVELVHVAPEGEIAPQNPENKMYKLLAEAARQGHVPVLASGEADVAILTDGNDIAQVVRNIALRKRIDLVVIGRGIVHGPFAGFRTHSYGIIREAPCPVISV